MWLCAVLLLWLNVQKTTIAKCCGTFFCSRWARASRFTLWLRLGETVYTDWTGVSTVYGTEVCTVSVYNIHTGRAPQYLVDCVSLIASSSSLQLGLCSSHTAKYVKHTTRTKLGKRAFSSLGPAAWNAIPASLHDIPDISKFFKNHLRPSCLNEHSLLPNCFTVLLSLKYCFHCTVLMFFMFYCMWHC